MVTFAISIIMDYVGIKDESVLQIAYVYSLQKWENC